MTTAPNALAQAAQVEALADQLSACADEIHARVMKDINERKGPHDEAGAALARALLDDEVLLRQRANGLYADAAGVVVKSLGQSQQQLMRLTADAAEKIRKIDRIRDATGLVGGLLMLAGAVASGQPAPIVLSIERIRKHLKMLDAHSPRKPA